MNCGGGTWKTLGGLCVLGRTKASLRLVASQPSVNPMPTAQCQPKATRWLSAGRTPALDKPKTTTRTNTLLPPTPETVQDRPRPQAWARREFIGQGDQKSKQQIKNRKNEKRRNTILQNSSSPSPALSLQREACGKTLVHFIRQGHRKPHVVKN